MTSAVVSMLDNINNKIDETIWVKKETL
jgi:hypothetical protein